VVYGVSDALPSLSWIIAPVSPPNHTGLRNATALVETTSLWSSSPGLQQGNTDAVPDVPEPEFLTPPTRVDGPIKLAEPERAWERWFAGEEERIREALGPRALRIEHVGSTSVPSLPAKPIIDILLVVADSSDEAGYVPDLESAGYRLQFREPSWHEHRFLVDREPQVQIHVFTVGDTEVDRMVRFRDRLRNCPEDRDLYQRTKSELAARSWVYVQDYADAKSSVVETIIARAREDRLR
jgi:GrpB-like predicted nucleotidyltransferase (UPF0157 family)